MKHIVDKDNFNLILMKGLVNTGILSTVLLSETGIDLNFYGFQTYLLPLYLYPDENSMETSRRPNFDPSIIKEFAEKVSLKFVPEKTDESGTFAPIDVLDYIYGVLHSPSYREKYKEFLKIDFPRVPYPKNSKKFFEIAHIGAELRKLHLMDHPILEKPITKYPIEGDNVVEKVKYLDGKVWINATQYFDGVPEDVWNFYVGGYQVCDKWLKDRKGRELSYEDIVHYQRIVVALKETIRLMSEVDTLIM